MNKSYDGELVLPKKCNFMDEDEMTYVEGGGLQLKMSPGYVKKALCYSAAVGYKANGSVKGMTALEIAQEIYAHAVAYYHGGLLNFLNPFIASEIRYRSKVIDIEDGGDKRPGFMEAYALVWKCVEV